jgi:hypothetical protein
MRILKPVGIEIDIDGKDRHLLFNVNVIDELQEHFDLYIGDILNALLDSQDKEKQKAFYDSIAFILAVLLNEDVRIHNKNNPNDPWEKITEEYLKEEVLTNSTSATITLEILKSFNGTLPKSEEDDPNLKSGKTRK